MSASHGCSLLEGLQHCCYMKEYVVLKVNDQYNEEFLARNV